jgi:hypothetical protein
MNSAPPQTRTPATGRILNTLGADGDLPMKTSAWVLPSPKDSSVEGSIPKARAELTGLALLTEIDNDFPIMGN